ncbi:hypothetical protein FRX31_004458 [Thalictrum thalictroides]|uniref:Reverse transcriptase zinc-binding domain-containing protein n=1 Tax=Thalictrum thalictroides TaxID=46969 RepID=A0A7J6X8A7_THATH|nr:hypothetical protein FRX31_004458 [Thalictrum thalictroides]
MAWKIQVNAIETMDNVMKRGIPIASRCCLCKDAAENRDHLLWQCSKTEQIWSWMCAKFNTQFDFTCIEDAMKKMKQRSKLIKDIWNSAVIATIVAIWKLRNKITHEEKDLNAKFCEKMIENQVKVTARLSKATGYNNLEKLKITREWQITTSSTNHPTMLLEAP